MSATWLEHYDEQEGKRAPRARRSAAVSANVAREWERRLADEGLADEVPVDEAAQRLREQQAEAVGVSEADIRAAIERYWLDHGEVQAGNHMYAAQVIGERLGLPAGYIDEGMMKEVEEYMRAAQVLAFHTARDIARGDLVAATSERRLMAHLRARIGDRLDYLSDDVRYEILADAAFRAAMKE